VQDLWASCGYDSTQCHTEYDVDAGTSSFCFESGASFAGFASPLCGATDAGNVEQVVTPFMKPDGSPCYVLRIEYSSADPLGGSCTWLNVRYTWMDAAGSTIATQVYVPGGTGSFTCANGGTISCVYNPDDHSHPQCPTLEPYCYGAAGTCPFPRDASSQ
jgi:hypothetical protein